jgi:putative NADPH-quinone reductase
MHGCSSCGAARNDAGLRRINTAQRTAADHAAMEPRQILLIQGHPDPAGRHFGHALADAYAEGAQAAGHAVRRIEVSALDFPLLRSQAEWLHGSLPAGLVQAQAYIGWAQHLVLCFPLWMGDMPALLKGFLEQVARPGFAFTQPEPGSLGKKGLTGRSARVVVTMGMPAAVYRYYFRAHSVKSLERNILGFMGIAPVHSTLIGNAEGADSKPRGRWLLQLRELGAQAG